MKPKQECELNQLEKHDSYMFLHDFRHHFILIGGRTSRLSLPGCLSLHWCKTKKGLIVVK